MWLLQTKKQAFIHAADWYLNTQKSKVHVTFGVILSYGPISQSTKSDHVVTKPDFAPEQVPGKNTAKNDQNFAKTLNKFGFCLTEKH